MTKLLYRKRFKIRERKETLGPSVSGSLQTFALSCFEFLTLARASSQLMTYGNDHWRLAEIIAGEHPGRSLEIAYSYVWLGRDDL